MLYCVVHPRSLYRCIGQPPGACVVEHQPESEYKNSRHNDAAGSKSINQAAHQGCHYGVGDEGHGLNPG